MDHPVYVCSELSKNINKLNQIVKSNVHQKICSDIESAFGFKIFTNKMACCFLDFKN